MQAIVRPRYGQPEVLELREVAKPELVDDGVLVRVRASSVNAGDWYGLTGTPYLARARLGLRRPKSELLGSDFAGTVEAAGKDVPQFRPGDEVFGGRSGAFAEYVAGRVRNFVLKPTNLSFEEAAALPVAATTALQAVRDQGQLQAGQRVLVLGAGGGVGSLTVQIAKALGAAHVTAATSTANLEMVRSLGADEVVDYTREDATASGRRFDLILDIGGYRRLRDLAKALVPGGTIVLVGAGNGSLIALLSSIVTARLRSRFLGQRMRFFLATINRPDLLVIADLATDGKLRPVIARSYPLDSVGEAIARVETGQVAGKLVVTP